MSQIILHPREGRTAKDYALLYVGMGWKVFPVWGVVDDDEGDRICACPLGAECDRPGKHPIADVAPSGLGDATSERQKVEAWWGRYPHASIGIATGAVSGITVIDADVGDGKPGLINLTRLFAPHGGVPSTICVVTGGGGLHLYFKYNAALGTGTNVLAEAIDVRNDGGYVIAAPSHHYTGGQYKFREDRAELLPLPEWLLNAPAETRTRGRGRPRTKESVPLDKVQAMLVHIDPDDRDNWLKIGLIVGRAYVGTPAEAEAWAMYEAWAARSEKYDENRSANVTRMREQFYERSQLEPRAGQEPANIGSLVYLARQGGWTPFGNRTIINYEPGNESEMCSMLVEALTADPDNNCFFNVMGEIREVLRAPVSSLRMRFQSDNQAEYLMVRGASVAALQGSLSEKAVIAVTLQGIPKAKPIPETLVSIILKAKSREFPNLTGIAEWPMVIDGKVLMRDHGYDEETGLYFDIAKGVTIDEKVKPKDAWKWIRNELLADFPFESELHAAGTLGLLLSMMQRPLMRTCPAFAIVAPQPGTGKTTLVEVCAVSVYGNSAFSHSFSSEDEELRKALHSVMIAKIPMVMFDNIKRGISISSDHLAKLITSEVTSDRVLGSSETRHETNTLLITFTGNNIAFVRDMASRVITLRLNAKSEDPIGRRFQHPDIKGWAYERRSRLLSGLVAIAKLADGTRPETGRPSRFDDYDTLIVKPILDVTGIDIRDLDVPVDSDVEEVSLGRDVLRILWQWQQELRGEENGKPWKTIDVISAIDSRSFSDTHLSAIKRFTGNERFWDSDPVRALAYAFRSTRDDYNLAPFLLTADVRKDGAHWSIKNAAATAEPAAANTF